MTPNFWYELAEKLIEIEERGRFTASGYQNSI